MSTSPPFNVPVIIDTAIPDDLKERDQWCLWRYEPDKNGRLPKRPYQANGTLCSSIDPNTWTTFADAIQVYNRGGFSGIGFIFTGADPFCGIDLDNCLTNGELKPWAQRFVARFCHTYCEVSPSGNGIKIFCKGSLAGKGHKKEHKEGAIEIYDRGRFFTVTGEAWRGSPPTIEDHQADVDHVYAWAQRQLGRNRKYDLNDFPKIGAKKKAGDPSRHEFLVTQAARLRNAGMEFPELHTALRALNLERCDPPKPDKEVEDLARYFAGMESRSSKVIQMRSRVDERCADAPNPNVLVGFAPEDVGNGQRLRVMFGDGLRFCYAFNKWLLWDGRRWNVDETEQVRKLAQQTMEEFAVQAVRANSETLTKFAAQCRKSPRITNALREAQPHLAITHEQLDTHPFLLNFMNGSVDVRTGELQPHTREHLVTKLVHYDYRPNAKMPHFYAVSGSCYGRGARRV